jgi:ABC-2 type transport system ATP-binding protein
MQRRIRAFIADYNRRHAASVLLTSHYMADVEALCKRVIVIDHGRIRFDGDLGTLATDVAAYKELGVTVEGDADLGCLGEVVAREGDRVTLRVPKAQAPVVTARLLAEHTVLDLTVEDPPIDDVIELLFNRGDRG